MQFMYFSIRCIDQSVHCRTALAEAEIEYNDNYCSPSVYVRYQLHRLSDALTSLGNVIYIYLLSYLLIVLCKFIHIVS